MEIIFFKNAFMLNNTFFNLVRTDVCLLKNFLICRYLSLGEISIKSFPSSDMLIIQKSQPGTLSHKVINPLFLRL